MGHYYTELKVFEEEKTIKKSWNSELEAIKVKVNQVTQLDAQKALLNAKKSTVIQLLQGRLLYPKCMAAFFSTIPKDVWVSNLTFAEDKKNINISATSTSLSIDAIAEWLQTLESKPNRFLAIDLSAIQVQVSEESTLYAFSMKFTYSPPPEGV